MIKQSKKNIKYVTIYTLQLTFFCTTIVCRWGGFKDALTLIHTIKICMHQGMFQYSIVSGYSLNIYTTTKTIAFITLYAKVTQRKINVNSLRKSDVIFM